MNASDIMEISNTWTTMTMTNGGKNVDDDDGSIPISDYPSPD